jgi:hypothetical protein
MTHSKMYGLMPYLIELNRQPGLSETIQVCENEDNRSASKQRFPRFCAAPPSASPPTLRAKHGEDKDPSRLLEILASLPPISDEFPPIDDFAPSSE